MKLFAVLFAALFATSVFAADTSKAVQNDVKKPELNCVKKDKNGKCPPAPKSPKPTPKKKAEKA